VKYYITFHFSINLRRRREVYLFVRKITRADLDEMFGGLPVVHMNNRLDLCIWVVIQIRFRIRIKNWKFRRKSVLCQCFCY